MPFYSEFNHYHWHSIASVLLLMPTNQMFSIRMNVNLDGNSFGVTIFCFDEIHLITEQRICAQFNHRV